MPSSIGSLTARRRGICSRCAKSIEIGEIIKVTSQPQGTQHATFGHIRCPDRATNVSQFGDASRRAREDEIRRQNAAVFDEANAAATRRADEARRNPRPTDAPKLASVERFEADEAHKRRVEEMKRWLADEMDSRRRSTESSIRGYLDGRLDALRDEKTITIKWQMPDGTFKPLPAGLYHKMFARLLKLCKRRMWPYLYGSPGGGKTEAAHQVAKALELDFGTTTLSQDTFLSRLVGFLSPDGKYVETDFYRIFVYGGIFLIDEMDNGNGNVSTALNSALANKRFAFPNGLKMMHKDCIIIATGNTTGYGGNINHQDRSTMDAATRNRFFFLNWEYDWSLVRQITTAIHDSEITRGWVNWIEKVSVYCVTNYPELMVTPRAAISGAICLADGDRQSDLLDGLVFQGYDKDSVARIFSMCGRPV